MANEVLHRYNPLNESFDRFNFDLSRYITADKEGYFWIPGNEYLLRFDPITSDTVSFRYQKPIVILQDYIHRLALLHPFSKYNKILVII